MNREELKEKLSQGVYHIQFEKVDGSLRDMKCTLNKNHIPERSATGTTREHRINETVLPVWDVEAEGWRSFRIESLKEMREIPIL